MRTVAIGRKNYLFCGSHEAANNKNHFNKWQDSDEHIAYGIMMHILKGNNSVGVVQDEVSKSIIAQHFAKNLNEDTVVVDYRTEPSLKYLFEAITYAASN